MTFMFCLHGAKSQEQVTKFGIFDHLSAGLTLGTSGIGIDIATSVTEHVQVRAGYSFIPKFTYKTDVGYKMKGTSHQTEIEGKLSWGNAKLLVDVYPFKNSSLHATIGAYIGTDGIVTAQNNTPITGLDPGEGLEIADYIISPDENGIAKASIKVASFKPYLGIGIGRAVPRGRFCVSGDLGMQFWGEPAVYKKQSGEDVKLKSQDLNGHDGGLIKTLSKVTVYPVMTIRVSGRIL
ncbi:hypothetical protein [Prevotella sp. OH937_COT-195]|uniref:hypothetical protein n=1 Tax=Prevotella sp. OH937_COT-195 TaxID=2491051 RepID=UPI000F650AD7|nr:hypothetical protein [Prevotella sp. OH937_COT-195]RRC98761.1 hypothetical protein EII32_08825 [Prevotella sp. OH937_COT-195]